MKKTQQITFCGIFLALYLVADIFIPRLPIIPGLNQLSLSIFILPLFGLYIGGPRGFFLGVLADILSYFFTGSQFIFNPLFTLQSGIVAACGGFLYHKAITWKNALFTASMISIFGIIIANTIALTLQYTVLTSNTIALQTVFTSSLLTRIFTALLLYLPLFTLFFYALRFILNKKNS